MVSKELLEKKYKLAIAICGKNISHNLRDLVILGAMTQENAQSIYGALEALINRKGILK